MAATAVTLCLPLPVNQLPFSICQSAIIKVYPAANAVAYPPLHFQRAVPVTAESRIRHMTCPIEARRQSIFKRPASRNVDTVPK